MELFKQLPRRISLEQREIDGFVSRFLLSASAALTEDGEIENSSAAYLCALTCYYVCVLALCGGASPTQSATRH